MCIRDRLLTQTPAPGPARLPRRRGGGSRHLRAPAQGRSSASARLLRSRARAASPRTRRPPKRCRRVARR
eukprot:2926305-Alexandrium_andersonii.AAC.1